MTASLRCSLTGSVDPPLPPPGQHLLRHSPHPSLDVRTLQELSSWNQSLTLIKVCKKLVSSEHCLCMHVQCIIRQFQSDPIRWLHTEGGEKDHMGGSLRVEESGEPTGS